MLYTVAVADAAPDAAGTCGHLHRSVRTAARCARQHDDAVVVRVADPEPADFRTVPLDGFERQVAADYAR